MVSKLKQRYLSESDIDRIEKLIGEIEKKTSGELVLAIVPVSDSYFRIRLVGALSGWLLGSCGLYVMECSQHFGFPLSKVLCIQLFAMGLGIILSYFPLLGRRLVPLRIRARNVHREALARFTSLGLNSTRQHTGILVLVSLFEQQVHIIADSGIHRKVPSGYWKTVSDGIAAGFKTNNAAEAVTKALETMGSLLSEHFPPEPNNPNELSNRVRFLT
jgi:putative membrane protein